MTRERIHSKKIVVDLDYLMPDTVFVYPLFSIHGEKLLDERETLTGLKIKSIREKYGNRVYYSLPGDEAGIIPDFLITRAFSQTKMVMDGILRNDRFNKDDYKKSEELVEEIIEQLDHREIKVINLLKDMKSYDNYLYYHSLNVGFLTAILIKKWRKYSISEAKNVVLGAYLSDLGKIKIEKNILYKPDKLNEKELIEVKLHPQHGYNIVKSLEGISPVVLQTILFHHERYDDEGYYNLPYETLPSSPKVVAICDTYDALTSPRPFRQSYSPAEAMKLIVNSIDTKFDRQLVSDFINSMGSHLNHSQSFYKKGDFCILTTNEIAIVTDLGNKDLLKPKVMVFAKYVKTGQTVSINYYKHPIEVDLLMDLNRSLSNIIVSVKLIEAIRARLIEKRTLVDYLFTTIPVDSN